MNLKLAALFSQGRGSYISQDFIGIYISSSCHFINTIVRTSSPLILILNWTVNNFYLHKANNIVLFFSWSLFTMYFINQK